MHSRMTDNTSTSRMTDNNRENDGPENRIAAHDEEGKEGLKSAHSPLQKIMDSNERVEVSLNKEDVQIDHGTSETISPLSSPQGTLGEGNNLRAEAEDAEEMQIQYNLLYTEIEKIKELAREHKKKKLAWQNSIRRRDTQTQNEDTQTQNEDTQMQGEDTQMQGEDTQTQDGDIQMQGEDTQTQDEDIQMQDEDTQSQKDERKKQEDKRKKQEDERRKKQLHADGKNLTKLLHASEMAIMEFTRFFTDKRLKKEHVIRKERRELKGYDKELRKSWKTAQSYSESAVNYTSPSRAGFLNRSSLLFSKNWDNLDENLPRKIREYVQKHGWQKPRGIQQQVYCLTNAGKEKDANIALIASPGSGHTTALALCAGTHLNYHFERNKDGDDYKKPEWKLRAIVLCNTREKAMHITQIMTEIGSDHDQLRDKQLKNNDHDQENEKFNSWICNVAHHHDCFTQDEWVGYELAQSHFLAGTPSMFLDCLKARFIHFYHLSFIGLDRFDSMCEDGGDEAKSVHSLFRWMPEEEGQYLEVTINRRDQGVKSLKQRLSSFRDSPFEEISVEDIKIHSVCQQTKESRELVGDDSFAAYWQMCDHGWNLRECTSLVASYRGRGPQEENNADGNRETAESYTLLLQPFSPGEHVKEPDWKKDLTFIVTLAKYDKATAKTLSAWHEKLTRSHWKAEWKKLVTVTQEYTHAAETEKIVSDEVTVSYANFNRELLTRSRIEHNSIVTSAPMRLRPSNSMKREVILCRYGDYLGAAKDRRLRHVWHALLGLFSLPYVTSTNPTALICFENPEAAREFHDEVMPYIQTAVSRLRQRQWEQDDLKMLVSPAPSVMEPEKEIPAITITTYAALIEVQRRYPTEYFKDRSHVIMYEFDMDAYHEFSEKMHHLPPEYGIQQGTLWIYVDEDVMNNKLRYQFQPVPYEFKGPLTGRTLKQEVVVFPNHCDRKDKAEHMRYVCLGIFDVYVPALHRAHAEPRRGEAGYLQLTRDQIEPRCEDGANNILICFEEEDEAEKFYDYAKQWLREDPPRSTDPRPYISSDAVQWITDESAARAWSDHRITVATYAQLHGQGPVIADKFLRGHVIMVDFSMSHYQEISKKMNHLSHARSRTLWIYLQMNEELDANSLNELWISLAAEDQSIPLDLFTLMRQAEQFRGDSMTASALRSYLHREGCLTVAQLYADAAERQVPKSAGPEGNSNGMDLSPDPRRNQSPVHRRGWVWDGLEWRQHGLR